MRPAVPFDLIGPDGKLLSTRPRGIVDSGCDFTTFPQEWAERLGIDVRSECITQHGTTAGGSATQHFYVPGVRALFLGKEFAFSAIFAPQCPHVLLGREDFFRYFKSVNFDQAKEELRLVGAVNWAAAARAAKSNVKQLGLEAHAHVQQL